jgi:hypothetical protein
MGGFSSKRQVRGARGVRDGMRYLVPDRRLVVVITTASVLSLFGNVAAQRAYGQNCQGAPGTSAVEQYCEAVPRADGGSDRGNSAPQRAPTIPIDTSRQLKRSGPDGEAIERLVGGAVQPGKPPVDKEGSSSSSSASSVESVDEGAVRSERADPPSDPSSNPLKAASKAVAGGPVVGQGVVWGVIGLSVLGVGSTLILRRRGLTLDTTTDPD